MILAHRYHDISCGHRVFGHESKCKHLHGHNYRIHFSIESQSGALDPVGRVLDFNAIKAHLCAWLEREWDHKLLLWVDDPWVTLLTSLDKGGVVALPFNPTAENMAVYLLETVAPKLLAGAVCVGVRIEETAKCHASAWLEGYRAARQ